MKNGLILFFVLICLTCCSKQVEKCLDLNLEYRLGIENITLLEKPQNLYEDQQTPCYSAYFVKPSYSEIVEAYLVKNFDMGELVPNDYGWENKNEKKGFYQKKSPITQDLYLQLSIEMYGESEVIENEENNKTQSNRETTSFYVIIEVIKT